MEDSYYKSRYVWNKDRGVVWKEIVNFLKPWISRDTVVDLGAGYCDFINNVIAKKRIAVDYSPELKNFVAPEILVINSSVTDLSSIESGSVGTCFASNLLEHLDDKELAILMNEVKRILKLGGRLILLQPNYRLSYKTYFDDPTHKKVFSDVALVAFLKSHNFKIEKIIPGFLPFSMASRPQIIPIFPWMIRLYMFLPWKPFAGQMLCVAVNK